MTQFEPEKAQVAWEKVVDTQMHFNDICMRIRALFLTAVVSIVGAVGYLLANNVKIETAGFDIPVVIIALLVGWLTCYLFYLLDFKHYHQFLQASVQQGMLLEESLGPYWNSATLASAIKEISSNNEFGSKFHHQALIFFDVVIDDRAKGTEGSLHSDGRIQIFYRLPMKLFALGCLLCAVLAIVYKGRNLVQWIWNG